MPLLPQLQTREIDGRSCWMIDWRKVFSHHLRFHHSHASGEMRGFHVVFRVRARDSGTLIFWDDDGSIIRCNGKILHEDRECHALARHEIVVRAGDCLEIAQWQYHGDWIWAACLDLAEDLSSTLDIFSEYLPRVRKRLAKPNGPPLKMYFGDGAPARTVLCLYSMVLNGYCPASIHIFGEYQWSDDARKLFEALLPFTKIVPTAEVLDTLNTLSPGLAGMAKTHWLVMKLCSGVLCTPSEYCYLDDDIFILDSVEDATRAFQSCNLVYASDADYSADYSAIWNVPAEKQPLSTGNINAGFYWLRNTHIPRSLVARILSRPPYLEKMWQWEQGFMAVEYSGETAFALPSQRYFYPYFDGLPGGITGYDYARNPCGFASVHFGGLAEKPSDATARMLVRQVLKPRRNRR